MSLYSARRAYRDLELAGGVASAALDPDRPILCFLTVTRRCNLSCGYCFEYDDTSPPVAYEDLVESISHLKRLRTVMVTLNGGEPLLHPRVPDLVRQIRANGMIAGLNTNGFLLTRELIRELNEAGLFVLQMSIDSVRPNATTQKSLKTLRSKLALLAEHAKFRVRVNTVLGAAAPEEAEEVARVVIGYGFDAKSALVRHADGSSITDNPDLQAAAQKLAGLGGRSLGLLRESFQNHLAQGQELSWKCRAGARYFQVCERGLVHLCGPKMHTGTIALRDYTVANIRNAFMEGKDCAPHCAVAYARQIAPMDAWRPQDGKSARPSGRVHLPLIGER